MEEKSEKDFEIIKQSGNRRRACRKCISIQKQTKWLENPEKRMRQRRSTILKHKYGITIEAYEALLAAQCGKCKICQKEFNYVLRVDHDHTCCYGQKTCGECIRGLLCIQCNAGLGMFRDSIESLQYAIQYLEGGWRQLE